MSKAVDKVKEVAGRAKIHASKCVELAKASVDVIAIAILIGAVAFIVFA